MKTSVNEDGEKLNIGDVYLIKFDGDGNVQQGWRPGVIFQNNTGNQHSPNIIALPLTTAIKKINQPTHVFIKACAGGLIKDSIVLCENPRSMSKENLGRHLTTLSKDNMKQIAEASLLATSAIAFLDISALHTIWKKAVTLNAMTKK